MLRQILVVHDQATVATELDRVITAHISDASVITVDSVLQAVEAIGMFNIHLVLFSCRMVGEKQLVDVYHQLQSAGSGKTTPLLLLTEGAGQEPYRQVLESGANGCLALPCSDSELCWQVERYCNPERLRGAKRYSIPHCMAFVEQGDHRLSGRVVNISVGGVLCQLDDPASFDWTRPFLLNFRFQTEDGPQQIDGFTGVLVSLNVMSANPDNSPTKIHAAFRFVTATDLSKQQLADIFADYEAEQLSIPRTA